MWVESISEQSVSLTDVLMKSLSNTDVRYFNECIFLSHCLQLYPGQLSYCLPQSSHKAYSSAKMPIKWTHKLAMVRDMFTLAMTRSPNVVRFSWVKSGPVFCLLLGESSDYAQPITGQVTEVTCPVIGWAQSEQKTENEPRLLTYQILDLAKDVFIFLNLLAQDTVAAILHFREWCFFFLFFFISTTIHVH